MVSSELGGGGRRRGPVLNRLLLMSTHPGILRSLVLYLIFSRSKHHHHGCGMNP